MDALCSIHQGILDLKKMLLSCTSLLDFAFDIADQDVVAPSPHNTCSHCERSEMLRLLRESGIEGTNPAGCLTVKGNAASRVMACLSIGLVAVLPQA